jgi:hypothetical protein
MPTALGISVTDADITFLEAIRSVLIKDAKENCCGVRVHLSCSSCFFWSNSSYTHKAAVVSLIGYVGDVNSQLRNLLVQADPHGTGNVTVCDMFL